MKFANFVKSFANESWQLLWKINVSCHFAWMAHWLCRHFMMYMQPRNELVPPANSRSGTICRILSCWLSFIRILGSNQIIGVLLSGTVRSNIVHCILVWLCCCLISICLSKCFYMFCMHIATIVTMSGSHVCKRTRQLLQNYCCPGYD